MDGVKRQTRLLVNCPKTSFQTETAWKAWMPKFLIKEGLEDTVCFLLDDAYEQIPEDQERSDLERERSEK